MGYFEPRRLGSQLSTLVRLAHNLGSLEANSLAISPSEEIWIWK